MGTPFSFNARGIKPTNVWDSIASGVHNAVSPVGDVATSITPRQNPILPTPNPKTVVPPTTPPQGNPNDLWALIAQSMNQNAQTAARRADLQGEALHGRHLGMSGGVGGNATDSSGNNPFGSGGITFNPLPQVGGQPTNVVQPQPGVKPQPQPQPNLTNTITNPTPALNRAPYRPISFY